MLNFDETRNIFSVWAKTPHKGSLFHDGTKQVSLPLFCSHVHLMNRSLGTHHPYQSPSFLKVPIIIKPLKQIKARPDLFSPFKSINQTCLLGQWSLGGSGVVWRVLQTVQPECSAWAVKCRKRHSRGAGSPPHNEGRESCCKHTRLVKDKNRAGEWYKKKLNTEPQDSRGDSGKSGLYSLVRLLQPDLRINTSSTAGVHQKTTVYLNAVKRTEFVFFFSIQWLQWCQNCQEVRLLHSMHLFCVCSISP